MRSHSGAGCWRRSSVRKRIFSPFGSRCRSGSRFRRTRRRPPHPGRRIQDLRRTISRKDFRRCFGTPPGALAWAQTQSARHLPEKSSAHPGIVELLEGFWFGGQRLHARRSHARGDSFTCSLLARTGASFRGGMTAYRDFLRRLAKRLGAHEPPKLECKRVFVDQGRFTGVQVANRANVISGGGAIAGCALDQLGSLVSLSGRNWWKKLKASPDARRLAVYRQLLPSTRPRFRRAFRPAWSGRRPRRRRSKSRSRIRKPAGPGSGKRSQQRAIQVRTVLPFTEETLILITSAGSRRGCFGS